MARRIKNLTQQDIDSITNKLLPRFKKNIGKSDIIKDDDIEIYTPSSRVNKAKGVASFLMNYEYLSKLYTKDELIGECLRFIAILNEVPPQTIKELSDRISKFIIFLINEKEYTVYILIDKARGLPLGLRFFDLEIVKPDFKNTWGDFKKFASLMRDYNNNAFFKEKDIKESSWGKLVIKSYTTGSISDQVYDKLENPLAIISFAVHHIINTHNVLGIIYGPDNYKEYIYAKTIPDGSTHYSGFKDYFKTFSEMTSKPDGGAPSNLERNILRSIRMYSLSKFTNNLEIRLLVIMSAFECLLSNGEHDLLGYKLAEKTSFLIGNNGKERIKIDKWIKEMYGKRSSLVHSGNCDITIQEIVDLDITFRSLVYELIDLKDKNKTMNDVDNHIKKIKYYKTYKLPKQNPLLKFGNQVPGYGYM